MTGRIFDPQGIHEAVIQADELAAGSGASAGALTLTSALGFRHPPVASDL